MKKNRKDFHALGSRSFYIIFGLALLFILFYGRYENKNIIIPDKLDKDFPDAQVFTHPDTFPHFSLTDMNGNEFTHWRLARMWTLILFGYSQCDEKCSEALKKLGEIVDNLSKIDLLENSQAVFISVDSRYDNTQKIKEYLSSFNKNIIGLTGSPDDLKAITETVDLISGDKRKQPEETSPAENGLSYFLIDPLGGIRAVISSRHDTEQIAANFRGIREKYQEECCITGEDDIKTTTFDFRKKGD